MAIEDSPCAKKWGYIPMGCDEFISKTDTGFKCSDCNTEWLEEED